MRYKYINVHGNITQCDSKNALKGLLRRTNEDWNIVVVQLWDGGDMMYSMSAALWIKAHIL